jgi:hypothetical protein
MQKLKLIFRSIMEQGRRVSLFPKSILIAIRQRRGKQGVDADEAERLDRIRNPSNYHCK